MGKETTKNTLDRQANPTHLYRTRSHLSFQGEPEKEEDGRGKRDAVKEQNAAEERKHRRNQIGILSPSHAESPPQGPKPNAIPQTLPIYTTTKEQNHFRERTTHLPTPCTARYRHHTKKYHPIYIIALHPSPEPTRSYLPHSSTPDRPDQTNTQQRYLV